MLKTDSVIKVRTRYFLPFCGRVVGSLFMIAVCMFLVEGCSPKPTAQPTAATTPTQLATFTPSITPSPNLTIGRFIPTNPPRPTVTRTPIVFYTTEPTLRPTRDPNIPTETERPYTPMPTPTPLVPTIAALQYQLREWTPYRADAVISYLEYYPETLSDYEHGYHDSGYYGSFHYAALLQKESLLRFPVAQQVLEWRWGLAYNLAQTGHEELGVSATDIYAGLIIDALNSSEVEVDNLTQWFVEREPRLEFRSVDLPIPSQYSTSKLLEISRDQFCGAYLWLVGDQAGFDIYPLKNDTDFGFSSDAGISFDIADLTGDGVPEIVTMHDHAHGVGSSFYDARIDVFDVSRVPPQLLSFEPLAPNLGYYYLSIQGDDMAGLNLEIAVQEWWPCPGVNTYN